MIRVRPAEERGKTKTPWLDSRHTFSFNQYFDPKHVEFRALRVINEDWVAPGTGFPTHGHRDMEIITYLLSGKLAHKDNMGNGSIILPGDAQRMTAGRGITHSEKNASDTETAHLLQIWIKPREQGLTPGYEQKAFPAEEKQGRLRLLASGKPRDGAVMIHQDTDLYVTDLARGDEVTHAIGDDRHVWVQVTRGSVTVNGTELRAGDGAAVSNEQSLTIRGIEPSEVLLFDLA